MRAPTPWRALLLPLALVAIVGGPARADNDEASGYADGYQAGDYGRIRSADNGASIVRASADETGEGATVNSPIFPGDTVRTARDQRVEVQLASGTLVRIDGDSEIVFQSLPDPYAKFQDNSVLVLRSGAVRIAARVPDKQEFRVDTDASSVYLLGDGDFRIDAEAGGTTRVASLRGVAEVVGADGSVLVRGGSRTAVDPGRLPADPVAYRSGEDDGFDRWCAARDESYRPENRIAAERGDYDPASVPAEVRPYYGELAAYGTWAVVPDYGYVWYPSGVSVGWRPYYDGRWAYGPSGYFWVSAEPWGWAPYHYGCWQWVPAYGWCWIPGHVFAGAWVSWSWGSLYVGWAPLDYWGHPCWTGGPRYYGHYDPHSWTFVGYGHVGDPHVRRYAVPVDRVGGGLEHATLVNRAPRVAPRQLDRSPEARARALGEANGDGAARVRGTAVRGPGERSFIDLQSRLVSRGGGSAASRPSGGSRLAFERPGGPGAGAPRAQDRAWTPRETPRAVPGRHETYPRRIVSDPRTSAARPAEPGRAPRDNVREFYDRMSRPRVTREPGRTDPPRAEPRRQAPEPGAPAPQSRATTPSTRSTTPPPRYTTPEPRYKAPEPRYQAPAPRYKAPEPRYQAPPPRVVRPEPPRQAPRAAPQQRAPQREQAHPRNDGGGKRKGR